MSRSFWFVAVVFSLSVGVARPEDKSALEKDPKGWIDLQPIKNLPYWKRVPLDDKGLSGRNPWSVDGKILQCDATGGIKEMLLFDKEFGDGIFHVEWRFRPVSEGKKDY